MGRKHSARSFKKNTASRKINHRPRMGDRGGIRL